jgi:hypothetical protein
VGKKFYGAVCAEFPTIEDMSQFKQTINDTFSLGLVTPVIEIGKMS